MFPSISSPPRRELPPFVLLRAIYLSCPAAFFMFSFRSFFSPSVCVLLRRYHIFLLVNSASERHVRKCEDKIKRCVCCLLYVYCRDKQHTTTCFLHVFRVFSSIYCKGFISFRFHVVSGLQNDEQVYLCFCPGRQTTTRPLLFPSRPTSKRVLPPDRYTRTYFLFLWTEKRHAEGNRTHRYASAARPVSTLHTYVRTVKKYLSRRD